MASKMSISVYRIMCYILLSIFTCSNFATSTFTDFSSKTPYSMSHQTPILERVDEWYYLQDVKGLSCSAVHANAVIRHGARFPGLDDFDEIYNLHNKLVVAMGPNVNPELYKWINKISRNDSDLLSPLGEVEQKSLGRRTALKLSTLFSGKEAKHYTFIVSSKERTKQSASAFYERFFSAVNESKNAAESDFDSKVDNQLMRFFSLCDNYISSVDDNKTAFSEYYKFLSSEKVTKIKEKIQEKLNIRNDTLTAENLELIYSMCGFETGLYNSSSWCSLLDDSDVEILEYLADLEHYYENGYGHEITWQQSCPLVSNIFSTIDKTIMDLENHATDGFLVGQFAFGHAETLGPLYAALGLFNDSAPLRADNYDEQMNRLFRTSRILPFSANLMFILYKCVSENSKEDNGTKAADYYLKLYVNEEPQLIPGCEEHYCPYHVVRKRYSDFVDHCNFKEICKVPNMNNSCEPMTRPLKDIYFIFLFLLWNLFF